MMATVTSSQWRCRSLGVGNHTTNLCKADSNVHSIKFLFWLKFLLILSMLVTSCESFAASKKKRGGGFGAAKQQKKGGGFGKAPPSSSTTSRKPAASIKPEIQIINLGPDKTVQIHVPPNALSTDLINKKDQKKFATAASSTSSNTVSTAKAQSEILNAYGSFRGKGDVIWPSSLHLARLVANCPSFVTNRRVIDLGCGLGLASLATLLGNPSKLILSDIDEDVLGLAVQSCTEMIANDKSKISIQAVEKMCIDWSDSSTYPSQKGEYDVVLASDVLYDKEAARHLSTLIAHLLLNLSSENGEEVEKRALIVDPANRQNRDEFVIAAARHGLLAQVAPFPGQEDDFVLINVTPAL